MSVEFFGELLTLTALLVLFLYFLTGWSTPLIGKLAKLFARTSPPVIGYKKALLSSGEPLFRGLNGTAYQTDDEATSYGFHAYRDFNEARWHEQEGNVLLEVLLSGAIQDHARGFVASHQRVLQVIPHRCLIGDCEEPPRNFIWSEPGQELAFFCQVHAEVDSPTLQELSYFLPQLDREKIPVSELENFVPTESTLRQL